MYRLTIIFCVIAAAYGIPLKFGRCPQPYTPFVLDVPKFSGKWYESGRSFTLWEMKEKCSNTEFTEVAENRIKIFHYGISKITNMVSGTIGYAALNKTELCVTYEVSLIGTMTRKLWILDTDNDTYTVMWSCVNYGFMHIEYAWLYVREGHINGNFSIQTQTAFTHAGLDPMSMSAVDHTNCP